jgi:integrase
MGLLVECPEWKKRNSAQVKACKCGFALVKFSGRVYWIDYLVEGQRRREKIGSNKAAAEHCKSNEGRQIGAIKKAFKSACRRAGIEDFPFHDLRHTAINNWRLQGHDYFRIMAATGHKTMTVFKRYSTVSKEELKALVGEKI